jgi:hypothetical protein
MISVDWSVGWCGRGLRSPLRDTGTQAPNDSSTVRPAVVNATEQRPHCSVRIGRIVRVGSVGLGRLGTWTSCGTNPDLPDRIEILGFHPDDLHLRRQSRVAHPSCSGSCSHGGISLAITPWVVCVSPAGRSRTRPSRRATGRAPRASATGVPARARRRARAAPCRHRRRRLANGHRD